MASLLSEQGAGWERQGYKQPNLSLRDCFYRETRRPATSLPEMAWAMPGPVLKVALRASYSEK